MITKYKDLEGNVHTIQTIERMIGTFAIFDNKSNEQVSLEGYKEDLYHKIIKHLIKKNGGEVI